MSKSLAIAIALLIATPCLAGKVYKNVGPDGKITYTDAPPKTGDAVVAETGIAARTPLPQVPKLESMVAGLPAELLTGVATSLRDPLTAATFLFLTESLVEALPKVCQGDSSYSRYGYEFRRATSDWTERNQALRGKKAMIFHDLLKAEAANKFVNQIKIERDAMQRRMQQLPPEKLEKWCDEALAKLAQPHLDPSANPSLVDTVGNYQPKDRTRRYYDDYSF